MEDTLKISDAGQESEIAKEMIEAQEVTKETIVEEKVPSPKRYETLAQRRLREYNELMLKSFGGSLSECTVKK